MLSMLQVDLDAEGLNSDFDLNSLIEGDVDDDDFGEEFVTALEEPKVDKKDGPVRVHFEPLKVSFGRLSNLGGSCLGRRGVEEAEHTVQNRLGPRVRACLDIFSVSSEA